MGTGKRTFAELSFEEKLTIVGDYLNSIKGTDSNELLSERMEWLRRHIPAYNSDEESNYIFISYSHRDFKPVYSDLAFFSYNNRKKVRFWYDEGLPAGDDWFLAANQKLNDPRCVGVVFYLSENFLRSSAVLREIEIVKKLKKPYFTITLENGKYCAEDFLDKEKDFGLLAQVEAVFPRKDTSVSYGAKSKKLFPEAQEPITYDDEYENVFYRVLKIEQTFGVVEELFSDFVFEETKDGLSLTEYRGDETIVYIPDRIGKQPVKEIKASFDHATEIYIPRSVERILPVLLKEEVGKVDLNSVVFGNAKNLTRIDVDKQNTFFYDKEGVLYNKNQTLVRMPPNHEWDDSYMHEVKKIGTTAFYRYQNTQATINIPSSVVSIESGSFAFAEVLFLTIDDGLKEIDERAFFYFSSIIPLDIPASVEKLGSFVFCSASVPFITINSDHLDEIPSGAFRLYRGDYIGLPDNVKVIRHGAFLECTELNDLKLPEGIQVIEDSAFSNCEKLHHINISRSVRYISPGAFDGSQRLKYISYGGTARDLYYLRMSNDLENVKYIDLFITKDDWFGRFRTFICVQVRKFIVKILEKKNSKLETEKKKKYFGSLTLSTVLIFLLVALCMFWLDYRRLVVKKPLDFLYWSGNIINALLIYMGSKHLYWSYIVNRNKKTDKKKIAKNKEKSTFFDAFLNILSIFFIVLGVLAFLITILVSFIFDIPIPFN